MASTTPRRARKRRPSLQAAPTTASPSINSPVTRASSDDLHADAAGVPLEVIDVRERVGQHVVHARLPVRRLGHGAEEAHAEAQQPAESVRHLVAQDAAQLVVVAAGEIAREQRHVVEVILRPVLNAGAQLVRRAGGGDRADRPGGRAAELRVLLQQHDLASGRARLDGRGQACTAAADDDDVEGLPDPSFCMIPPWANSSQFSDARRVCVPRAV